MQAVFDHSWRLLTEAERPVFQQLSIFRGGFSREAAKALTKTSFKILRSLVHKSFLRRTAPNRFDVHELLRQYGAEKLAGNPVEEARVRDRHSAYYCTFLQQRGAALNSAEQRVVLTEIEVELENIRLAWTWAVEQANLEAIQQALPGLFDFYERRSRFQEGLDLITLAADQLPEAVPPARSAQLEALRRMLSMRRGILIYYSGDLEAATTLLEASLTPATPPGEAALALSFLGEITRSQGNLTLALEYLERSVTLSRDSGNLNGAFKARVWLGVVKWHHFSQYQEAKELAEENLNLSRRLGRLDYVALALNDIAWTAAILGDYDVAEASVNEHLALSQEMDDLFSVAHCFLTLGWLSATKNGASAPQSLPYCEQAVAMFRETGHQIHLAISLGALAFVASELGEEEKGLPYAREGAALADEINDQSLKVHCLCYLGAVEIGLSQTKEGRTHLLEALQITHAQQMALLGTTVLFYLAKLLAQESDTTGLTESEKLQIKSKAVEILTLINHHPATEALFKNKAASLLADLMTRLPPEVVEAAQARGRARDLWQMVEALLAELSQPDWGQPKPSPTGPNNLPAQTTPFLGRETELAEIARLLADPTPRLVSILGPGGSGKTRLALEAAAGQLDRFEHGVFFVRLGPLSSPESIIPAIAEALNFSFYEGVPPEQQLHNYLREKRLLLVMDNYEHLLASTGGMSGGAQIAAELLKVAPGLKILATSRASINLREEQRFPLSGIDVPAEDVVERTAQSSAVALFLQSARRVRPDFELAGENVEPVARICRRVEGMPLAIILAAAWVELLTPIEIAAELERSLDFLESELRDLPSRQQSMRAVFNHSWRLLSEPERQVFRQASVFRGGFTREAAEGVTDASLQTLRGLVSKSFLQVTPIGRYEVHELLRQFGAERLETSKVADADTRERFEILEVRDRHSAYYCAYLQQREADLKGVRQQLALAEIEVEFENARAAWDWAVEQADPEAVEQALESLFEFYQMSNRFQEGHDDFSRAVTSLPRPPTETSKSQITVRLSELVLAKLSARQGAFAQALGHYEIAKNLLQQSLALARHHEEWTEISFSLYFLAEIAYLQGAPTAAIQLYSECAALCEAHGEQVRQAYALIGLGLAVRYQGQLSAQKQYHERSVAIFRRIGHQAGLAYALNRMGTAAFQRGEYAEAEQGLREGLAISREISDRYSIALNLGGLGLIAWAQGKTRLVEARDLHEQGLTLCREIGHRLGNS